MRERRGSWSRRRVLGAGLGLGVTLMSPKAHALGDVSQLDIAELQLGSGTRSRPNAWVNLLFETMQTTSVECEPRAVLLAPDDPALFAHPFSVLLVSGALPALSDREREQLQRYLMYGGFLLIDDTTGLSSPEVDTSVRRLVAQLFPTRPLAVLPADHSVYRSFFLLKRPMGRVVSRGVIEGVPQGSMHPLLYFRDDLSGALDRDAAGLPVLPCTPGPDREQRREAVKLGINLILYALTSNYKQDQAHVRELMRAGRLE